MRLEDFQRVELPFPVLSSADIRRTEAFWRMAGTEIVGAFDAVGHLVVRWRGFQLHYTAQPMLERFHFTGALHFRISDLAVLHAGFRDHASPLVVHPWGTREFTVTDPDGHTLTFAEAEAPD
jgi:hypothetical protein